MKYIVACMLTVFTSGCGLQNQINDLKNRSDRNEGDIKTVKSRLASLEAQMLVARSQLVTLGNSQDSQTAQVSLQIMTLQTQVTSTLVQIAVLQGYNNIVSIKDPCGAQGSNNEVFLKLSTGRYLASFSDNANGLNTRFTQLTDGNFGTTDGTNCKFTVSGGGTVISNEHN